MRKGQFNSFTDFGKGVIAGFLLAAIIFAFVLVLMQQRNKVKEIVEYAEKQQVIELLREDYINRDPALFLEDPNIRGAADGAAAEFERRLDEILYRFRNRLAD